MLEQAHTRIAVILGTPAASSIQVLCAAHSASCLFQPSPPQTYTSTFQEHLKHMYLVALHELHLIKTPCCHCLLFPKRETEAGSQPEQQQPERSLHQRPGQAGCLMNPGQALWCLTCLTQPCPQALVLPLTDHIPGFSNFPQITTRASLLLIHSNVPLITT